MGKNLRLEDALQLGRPLSVGIMVKPVGAACNLACRYCYYRGASSGVMSREMLERTVREAIAANDGPEVVFNWHGGEPLLAGLDFFREAVQLEKRYADGKRISNSIQTAGLLLTPDWASFFRDEDFLVGISIDGPVSVHDAFRRDVHGAGTFDRVLRGVGLLQSAGAQFNTLTTVNQASRGRGLEIYHFLKSIGSRYLQFLPVSDPLRPENIDAEGFGDWICAVYDEWVRHDVGRVFVNLFDATLAAWCGLPRGLCTSCETCDGSVTVDWSGNLYACDHFHGETQRLGNLARESLRDVLCSGAYFDFSHQKRESLPVKCLRCKYRFACGGECPAHRLHGRNLLCEGYRRFFVHSEPTMLRMRELLDQGRAPAEVLQRYGSR